MAARERNCGRASSPTLSTRERTNTQQDKGCKLSKPTSNCMLPQQWAPNSTALDTVPIQDCEGTSHLNHHSPFPAPNSHGRIITRLQDFYNLSQSVNLMLVLNLTLPESAKTQATGAHPQKEDFLSQIHSKSGPHKRTWQKEALAFCLLALSLPDKFIYHGLRYSFAGQNPILGDSTTE